MTNRHRRGGQAAVEVALVLPVICIGVVVVVQFIAACYNGVLLQRVAYERAREISAGMRPTAPWLLHNPLWGRGAFPRLHQISIIPQPWRPFRTFLLPHVTSPGSLATITAKSLLLPTRGFGKDLPILQQEAGAEAYLEPAIPGEG